MSDLIKHSKKALSVVTTVTTIVWTLGIAAMPVVTLAAAGDLVKAVGNPAVYLVDADGVTIHPFPHANVYTSWGFPANFSSVITTDISGFKVGNDVEFRDGSLVRSLEKPAVYFKSAGKLLPVVSANVFETLGLNYNNITWLPESFIDKYTKGSTLTSTTTHPDGTVVKYANSSKLYLLQGGAKREFATTDVAKVNGYAAIPVITIPATETYSDGSKIVVKESSLTVPTGVGAVPATTTPPVATQPVGSGLSVSLASDNPAASTVLADSSNGGNDGAQAFASFVKLALTAGADGAVKVTSIKLKRTGISADADLSSMFLFDGDNLGDSFVAASTSFSTGVVTFSKSAGLVTVPAGTTKYLTMRADIADDVGSGKTLGFDLLAASDIVTDKATVSGSFPLKGALMSTAAASDVGYVTVANVSPTGASSVNPGTTGFEGWRFSLVANDQDMEVRYLKLAMTGSASTKDLANFKLQVGGVDVSETVAAMNDDRMVIFKFPTAYKITKGQTKNVSLLFDVVSGSSRTIHWQIQEMYNGNIFDTGYKVYTKLNQANTWTVIESNSSTTNTSINSGTLTISKAADSTTGNVAAGATEVLVAKFKLKATGEDVRVNSLTVTTAVTGGLNDMKVYFKGAQVGSTSDADSTNLDAAFTFGTTVTIEAGKEEELTVKTDVKNAAGTNLAAAVTFAVTLAAGSSNARALSSSTAISTSSVAGNTLTVSTGTLTVAENTGVNDASASNPTGVRGDTNVLIGSFLVTAGAGEGVTITQITMTDDVQSTTGSSLADTFYNLRLVSGGPADANTNYAAGTAIGQTIGTLTDTEDTTYNFNPSPAIKLATAQQIVVNVYADTLTSATTTQLDSVNADITGVIYPSTVTATGSATNSSANGTMSAGLQNVYLATSGTLTVENVAASSQAKANILAAGSVDVPVYKFKMTALNEDVDVTRFIISDTIASEANGATVADGKPTSTLKNFKLFDATGQIGQTLSALTKATIAPVLGGYIDFNLGTANAYRVKKGTEVVITVKATTNTWPTISSGSTHTFSLDTNPINDGNAVRAVTARGVGSSTALNGPTTGVSGNALTIRRGYPLVEYQPLATSILSGGATSQAVLAKFKVTAVSGKVGVKKMTFSVSLSDSTTSTRLTLSTFKLYRNGGLAGSTEYSIWDGTGTLQSDELSHSGTATLDVVSLSNMNASNVVENGKAPNATSTYVTLLFGTLRAGVDGALASTGSGEETIDPGTSNTYELRADIANAHVGASTDSDSITVQLLGDDTVTTSTTQNLTAIAAGAPATGTDTGGYRYRIIRLNLSDDYNFLWSDYSANQNDHTNTFRQPSGSGKDWTHGYQVPSASSQSSYIPLDSWRLSKS